MEYSSDWLKGWSLQASCRDMDPEIFVLGDSFDLEVAIGTCETCPVKRECEESTRPDDFSWSVRGGHTPIEYTSKPVGKPGSRKIFNHERQECERGHDTHVVGRYETDQYCVTCREENVERVRISKEAAQKAAARASEPADGVNARKYGGKHYNSMRRWCLRDHDTHEFGRYNRDRRCVRCVVDVNIEKRKKEKEDRATLAG